MRLSSLNIAAPIAHVVLGISLVLYQADKVSSPVAASVAVKTINSAPALSQLPGAQQLDNFDRTGPGLGLSWVGKGPTIVNYQLVGSAGRSIFWHTGFGADQFASIKINALPDCESVSLLLAASGYTLANGAVYVSYNRCASPKIIIYSYNPTVSNFSPFNGANVTFNPGDVLSVEVSPNREVRVLYNNAFLVSDVLGINNAGFDVVRAGQIGVSASSSAVVLDDFNGGAVGVIKQGSSTLPDNFNRTGPGLGAYWVGSGPTIVNNQLVGGAGSSIFWQQWFGAEQWASIKINALPGCESASLLLKTSGNTLATGAVYVSYNRCASPKIIVYGYNPSWGGYAPLGGANVTFTPGDKLSVRARANRTVLVYYNDVLVASVLADANSVGFDASRAGQIGVSTSSSTVVLDDFDGGTVVP